MEFRRLSLPDVILVKPDVWRDERGFFLETYHLEKYRQGGLGEVFVQDNHSFSVGNVLRGLHAQLLQPQGKLVRAIVGEIFDVAVDIRPDSPAFRKWVGERLSGENHHQLYVPPGFAHGFCVLSETAHIQYKCTELYRPADEISIAWNDPEIGIDWPIEDPILNAKDREAPRLAEIVPKLRDAAR
ncbi:MAG TPA: dTDP-4-dehydrorhamnose 3,5-epimerase [Thermoanaerobaculia bacterium]|jgi:dTDP-4-dehydrorhamnose 3,5-epimerase|nr:dTDP-4-dehydrorhamnose 3,5-epimerase [Thermoanaerobaculia bacterium]